MEKPHGTRSTCPGRAEAPGEGLRSHISRPSEGKQRSPLALGDLRQNMGGGAKTIKTDVFYMRTQHVIRPEPN